MLYHISAVLGAVCGASVVRGSIPTEMALTVLRAGWSATRVVLGYYKHVHPWIGYDSVLWSSPARCGNFVFAFPVVSCAACRSIMGGV